MPEPSREQQESDHAQFVAELQVLVVRLREQGVRPHLMHDLQMRHLQMP